MAGGRDSGVFLSRDAGASWDLVSDPIDPNSSGTLHIPRPWFAYFDHEPGKMADIYIGTLGRGVFRLTPGGGGIGNDDFADRSELSGLSGHASASNVGATGESGEPNHAGVSAPLASLWWTWTAPGAGDVSIDTHGSDFDTTLAVYVGDGLESLAEVASNDDDGGPNFTSGLQFSAQGGVDYRIAVDGYTGAEGNIELDWETSAPCFVDLALEHDGSELTMSFVIESSTPAVWSTWIAVGPLVFPLWAFPLPAVTPPLELDLSFPFQPSVPVLFLTVLSSESQTLMCSDQAVFGPSPGAQSSAVTKALERIQLALR